MCENICYTQPMYRQYLELTCVYFHRFSNSLVYLMEYTSKKLACTLPHLVNLPFTMTMTTIWSEAFGTVFLRRNLYAQSLRLVDKANLHVDIPAPPPQKMGSMFTCLNFIIHVDKGIHQYLVWYIVCLHLVPTLVSRTPMRLVWPEAIPVW
jgi:hypothetical protein